MLGMMLLIFAPGQSVTDVRRNRVIFPPPASPERKGCAMMCGGQTPLRPYKETALLGGC